MAIAAAALQPDAAAFVLATDLAPNQPEWHDAEAQCRAVAAACAPILGFEPIVELAALGQLTLSGGASETFILPAALDFNLLEREALGRAIGEARRRHPETVIHHDDVDPAHPLLVECLADQAARVLTAPQRTGVIVAASGNGDMDSRAQSYRLMRLVWERLGLATGEIGFIRHAQPFLLAALERCARQPLDWIVLPQAQWRTQHVEFAEVILRDFQKNHPEASEWRMADPPRGHPVMTAWLVQRITKLWREKRARDTIRIASPKRAEPERPQLEAVGAGYIAKIADRDAMENVLARILPSKKPERVLVKVTWHGYATGTYTDPTALDLLLSALPAPAVILEGHTSSRNLGGATFDWETEARGNRAWIRREEAEFLRRTGLQDVLAKRGAQYVNVTEAYWDEAGAADEESGAFIPDALLALRGCPMISFAKFKGPTRLAISNLFGLLPEPLRSAWHGPNITYFARVCCRIAKLYGSLFDLCAVNEALFTAVRWNRQGLYRSRWGNYDLISNAGYATAGRGLVSADILAARLQGQDVNRSAFFDVVRAELGWDEQAAGAALTPRCL